jgi:peptidyl-tRNA hydrolase, PTH1 family
VLGKAPSNEQLHIEQAIDEAAICFEQWQQHGLKHAQQRLHSFKTI